MAIYRSPQDGHAPKGGGFYVKFRENRANALGDAYAASGDTESQWEALYRYLRTTVEFRRWRHECAEAFYKAGRLAQKLGVYRDGDRLFGLLRGGYQDSVWTQKLKQETAASSALR